LTGSIPTEIGKLVKLHTLRLGFNQLTGQIPSSLGKLTNLQDLGLKDNNGLTGTFTPQCLTTSGVKPLLYIDNTGVIICGCVAAFTPPTLFPPAGTPAACLAYASALTLAKRTEIFSLTLAGYKFACHVDTNKNPYADCTNSMAALCNTSDPTWSSDAVKRGRCRTAVNDMYGNMNPWWQAVRKNCGQWPFILNGITSTGVYPSSACTTANDNLIRNAVYNRLDGSTVKIDSSFTNSQNAGLWNKVTRA